ncbi:eukaryotic translation initiation factor 4B isoform X1 [Nematostella vectensis]|uniref:eukaryotic translation initiation factor 4B isoform X1 n=1 Tax=Nematostella vectensis TaxID=45351 RepID=UPI0020772604|nr:eukaryotic translation initiation factor 4B isoform X1 [Nematostella vectensis]
MADTGKKGKKKKGKTLNLTEFLSDGSSQPALPTASQGASHGNSPFRSSSWADEADGSLNMDGDIKWHDDSRRSVMDRAALPTAPRSSRPTEVDLSKIPDNPPFTAFLGNLPYDVEREDILEFFSSVKITAVRLPQDMGGGRAKGFGYAEFEDKASLIQALDLNNESLRGRKVRVDIAGHQQGGGGSDSRSDRRREGPDVFDTDWRSRPDPNPPREENGYSREDPFDRPRQDPRDSGFGRSHDGGFHEDRYRGSREGRNGGSREDSYGGPREDRYGGSREDHYGGSREDRYAGYGGDRYREDRGFGGGRDRYYDRRYDNNRYDSLNDSRRTGDRGYNGYRSPDDYYDRRGRDRGYDGRERDARYSSRGDSFGDKGESSWRSDGGGEFGGRGDRDRSDRYDDHGADRRDAPKERPRLQLQPRTKPPEETKEAPAESRSSAIFGGAKPVDTTSKEREIEEKLAKARLEEARQKEERERHNERDEWKRAGGEHRGRRDSNRSSDGDKQHPRRDSEKSTEDRVRRISADEAKPPTSKSSPQETPAPAVNVWAKRMEAQKGGLPDDGSATADKADAQPLSPTGVQCKARVPARSEAEGRDGPGSAGRGRGGARGGRGRGRGRGDHINKGVRPNASKDSTVGGAKEERKERKERRPAEPKKIGEDSAPVFHQQSKFSLLLGDEADADEQEEEES